MKKNLLTGLAILLPIAITLVIFIYLFNLITEPFVGMMHSLLDRYIYTEEFLIKHEDMTKVALKLLSLIVLIAFIWLLGFFGQRFAVIWMLKLTHRIFARIPLIKWVYEVTKEATGSFLKDQKKLFISTVLLPFPHKRARTLGLLIGEAPKEIDTRLNAGSTIQSVYVPTAPHPFQGFIIMVPEEDLSKTDISSEELFKFLLSCGTIDLNELRNQPKS